MHCAHRHLVVGARVEAESARGGTHGIVRLDIAENPTDVAVDWRVLQADEYVVLGYGNHIRRQVVVRLPEQLRAVRIQRIERVVVMELPYVSVILVVVLQRCIRVDTSFFLPLLLSVLFSFFFFSIRVDTSCSVNFPKTRWKADSLIPR